MTAKHPAFSTLRETAALALSQANFAWMYAHDEAAGNRLTYHAILWRGQERREERFASASSLAMLAGYGYRVVSTAPAGISADSLAAEVCRFGSCPE